MPYLGTGMHRLPEIHSISDLARDARGLLQRARERNEPIVITQRGHEAAVLLPVELYRELERLASQMVSPRLVRRKDAAQFRMEMTVTDERPG